LSNQTCSDRPTSVKSAVILGLPGDLKKLSTMSSDGVEVKDMEMPEVGEIDTGGGTNLELLETLRTDRDTNIHSFHSPSPIIHHQGPKSPVSAEKRANQLAEQVAAMSHEERLEATRKQVEYYFSADNLRNDVFLTSQMDAQRTVPMAVILKFPKLRALVNGDKGMLSEAIAPSTVIAVTGESGDRIKATFLDSSGSGSGNNRKTIILREVAPDATEAEIREIFAFDEFACEVESVRSDIGNCWFVMMSSESAAKDALLGLKLKRRQLRGESVKARLKTDSVVRSYFSQPAVGGQQGQQMGGSPTAGGMNGLGQGGGGMNFMPYSMGPYGMPPQGMMGIPPGGFPGVNVNPGFPPQAMGMQGMPMHGMMPPGAAGGGMPPRGQGQGQGQGYAGAGDDSQGPRPRGGSGNNNGSGGGSSGGGGGSAGGSGGNNNSNTSNKRDDGRSSGGNNRNGSNSNGNNTGGTASAGGAAGSGAGAKGSNNSNNNGGKNVKGGGNAAQSGAAGAGKGGNKRGGKDANEGGGGGGGGAKQHRGYVVDVSSFPQLGSLPVDDTPTPTPGYKGAFKQYSHDDIVHIVSQIHDVTVPLDPEGMPLDPTMHGHAMSNNANMDLLRRQRSHSIEEVREQMRQGKPVTREAILPAGSGGAGASSIAYGDAESGDLASRSRGNSFGGGGPVNGSSTHAKEAAAAAIDRTLDSAAAYLEAKSTTAGSSKPRSRSGSINKNNNSKGSPSRGASAVPSMSTWAALAAKAASTQTEPAPAPAPKKIVGVNTAASSGSNSASGSTPTNSGGGGGRGKNGSAGGNSKGGAASRGEGGKDANNREKKGGGANGRNTGSGGREKKVSTIP
jgi:hypothetical protein